MTRARGIAAAGVVISATVLVGCGEDGGPTVPDGAFPAAPSGFILSAAGENHLFWAWIAVPGAAGYAVQVSMDPAFDDADPIHTTETTIFQLDLLRPDTERRARVAAYTGEAASPNLGAWTSPVAGRTLPGPPRDVQLGFAAPRRAVLFEGGMLKAALEVHGRISDGVEEAFDLVVESDAPEDALIIPAKIVIRGHGGRNQVEIVGVADRVADPPAHYRISLAPPSGGLPPGVTLLEGGTTFRLTLRDTAPPANCSGLRLSAGASGFDAEIGGSAVEIRFGGPEHAGLRIEEPYPVLVGNGFRWLPWPAELVPTRLSQPAGAPAEGPLTIALNWTGDLGLVALARGCEPVTLTRRGASTPTGPRSP